MLLNEKCYVKHEYRKTANIRPRLAHTESQAFFGGLIQQAGGGESYIRNQFYVSSFPQLLLASQERGME